MRKCDFDDFSFGDWSADDAISTFGFASLDKLNIFACRARNSRARQIKEEKTIQY